MRLSPLSTIFKLKAFFLQAMAINIVSLLSQLFQSSNFLAFLLLVMMINALSHLAIISKLGT
jgi:hypothetical protein